MLPCSFCGIDTGGRVPAVNDGYIRRSWDTTTGRELEPHTVDAGQPLCETCEPEYEGEGGG
jgi:hypothetical protein